MPVEAVTSPRLALAVYEAPSPPPPSPPLPVGQVATALTATPSGFGVRTWLGFVGTTLLGVLAMGLACLIQLRRQKQQRRKRRAARAVWRARESVMEAALNLPEKHEAENAPWDWPTSPSLAPLPMKTFEASALAPAQASDTWSPPNPELGASKPDPPSAEQPRLDADPVERPLSSIDESARSSLSPGDIVAPDAAAAPVSTPPLAACPAEAAAAGAPLHRAAPKAPWRARIALMAAPQVCPHQPSASASLPPLPASFAGAPEAAAPFDVDDDQPAQPPPPAPPAPGPAHRPAPPLSRRTPRVAPRPRHRSAPTVLGAFAQLPGEVVPKLCTTLALLHQTDLARAEPLYRDALQTKRAMLGNRHQDTLAAANNLACLLYAKGNLLAAERLYTSVLRISAETLGDEHQHCLILRFNYAMLVHAKGEDSAEARRLGRETVSGARHALGAGHPTTRALVRHSPWMLAQEPTGDHQDGCSGRTQRSIRQRESQQPTVETKESDPSVDEL